MDDRTQEHIRVKARVYLFVWFGLVGLTGTTVVVADISLGWLGVVVAILIASVKSTLILLFFMHLRYDRGIFTTIFLTTLVVLMVFIGLTFSDIAYR